MTEGKTQMGYIGYEKNWTPKPCPKCGVMATSHGFLFVDPPPEPPQPDQRKAVGHVYIHGAGHPDCEIPGNKYL